MSIIAQSVRKSVTHGIIYFNTGEVMDSELNYFYAILDAQAIEDEECGTDAEAVFQLALDGGILEEIDREEFIRRFEELPF